MPGEAINEVFQLGGGFQVTVGTMLASGVVSDRLYFLKADASAGVFTVTLQPAASVPNRLLIIKKIDSTGNAVTISGSGSDKIDGSSSKSLSSQYNVIHLLSDGTNWHELASF